jgi:hypothetical protein
VDGNLLIDHWALQGATTLSSSVVLYTAAPVGIIMEYFENAGSAVAELSWESNCQQSNIISYAQMCAADPNTAIPPFIKLTAPANNSTATLGTPVTLTAAVTQESATVNQVDFYNGATHLGTVVQSGTGTYTYNGWTPPATGIYNITAKATYNTSGKLYTASNKLTVLPVPVSAVTISNIIGTTLTYGGGGGSHFVLLSSATADAPMSAWLNSGQTNTATPGSFTVPAVGTVDVRFYRVLSQ